MNQDVSFMMETASFGEHWYQGTADSVYQNLALVRQHAPDHVIILAADHIYKMDYGPMIAFHGEKEADITVGVVQVPLAEASGFGVMTVDETDRITHFDEKPVNPQPMPGNPQLALASMGIYVFDSDFLIDTLEADARDETSAHDFGRNIIPGMLGRYRISVYDSSRNEIPGMEEMERGYWRGVGDLEILDADKVKNVIVIKRGKGAGFSGIENHLFFLDNTRMLYGDAQGAANQLIQGLKAL